MMCPFDFFKKNLSPVCCATPGIIILRLVFCSENSINPGVFGMMFFEEKQDGETQGRRNEQIADLEF
jgi:hypothetical protein